MPEYWPAYNPTFLNNKWRDLADGEISGIADEEHRGGDGIDSNLGEADKGANIEVGLDGRNRV